MAYKPQINYSENISMEDNLKAIINWLNFLLREMTVGRVPENRETLDTNINETKIIQDNTDALLVDQEYRLALLELGLSEADTNA